MDGRQRTWEKRSLLLFVCSCHWHSASIPMHPSICSHWRKVSTRRSFPDFPGSDIPQQSYSVQMEPPSLSFQSRKPRHMHLPESGRRRQKTGVPYHLWRYGMGLSYKERDFGAGNISAVILGAAGVVTIAGVIRNKNRT